MMNRVGNQRVEGINMNAPVAAGELIQKTNMVALNADGYLESPQVMQITGWAVTELRRHPSSPAVLYSDRMGSRRLTS